MCFVLYYIASGGRSDKWRQRKIKKCVSERILEGLFSIWQFVMGLMLMMGPTGQDYHGNGQVEGSEELAVSTLHSLHSLHSSENEKQCARLGFMMYWLGS